MHLGGYVERQYSVSVNWALKMDMDMRAIGEWTRRTYCMEKDLKVAILR